MKDVAKLILLAALIWLLFTSIGLSHNGYQNWVNQRNQGCCNEYDCAPVKDGDERTVGDRIEIRIEGTWCPVEPWHYLKRGNAPDWSASHACVLRVFHPGNAGKDPCARFICYQPRPGT